MNILCGRVEQMKKLLWYGDQDYVRMLRSSTCSGTTLISHQLVTLPPYLDFFRMETFDLRVSDLPILITRTLEVVSELDSFHWDHLHVCQVVVTASSSE